MPRISPLTTEQRERLRAIAETRAATPSNRQLANEMDVTERLIEYYVRKYQAEMVGPAAPRHIPLDKPCSQCGGPRETESHPYCRSCFAAYSREHRMKHSELSDEQRFKANARARANVAQLRGRIAKLPCEKCGSPESEKHHDDYSQPLDVRWLCRACHLLEHETAGS